MEFPVRKPPRMDWYDYNTPGYYFVTLCTARKEKFLCDIVGAGLLDGPECRMKEYGTIAEAQLEYMTDYYKDIRLEKYVIMPNHIHLLLHITQTDHSPASPQNNRVSHFVGTFKRFCNRRIGKDIWQPSFHDHVIRGERDYLKKWDYIEHNASKWLQDCYCCE